MITKRWAASALCGAIGLSGCATGQDSLVAVSPSGDLLSEVSAHGDTSLARAAPSLLAVSGTALLPGSRAISPVGNLVQDPLGSVAAGASLISPAPILVQGASGGLVTGATARLEAGVAPQATLGVSSPGAMANASLAAPAVGPLLSITGGGTGARLTGGPTSLAILGASKASTVNVGAGALAVAPTQITVSATTAFAQSTMGSGAPMAGPRLPVTANPALLAGLTGALPVLPGRN